MVPSWPQVPGYVLLDPLGTGAGGRVWRARRAADGLLVALKVVQAADNDPAGALREAGVLARVRHPHLLHLYDVLPVPDDSGTATCLALAVQLADGGSLAQVLAARRHLTPGELVTLLVPLGGALAQLHEAAVVHGDVSPANVLFLADGMPMLGDVGVARLVGESDRAVHGTDGMVAPEVLEGFAPGPEADVYALGALAWWCLTGERPGWVGTRCDLVDLVPDVPEQLRELVQGAMSPEPDDRPQAQEVAAVALTLVAPEPIEVAPDVDPAAGLTRRLRAVARAETLNGTEAVSGAERWWGRWWSRRRHRPVPARHRARTEQAVAGGRLWWTGPRMSVPAVGALLAAAAVVVLLPGSGSDSSATDPVHTTTADGQPRSGFVPPAPSDAAPWQRSKAEVDARTAATTSSSVDPSAPGASAIEATVQTLVRARATAWSKTDPDLLDRALAVGSPAIEVDRIALTRAQRDGVDYEGVGFHVLQTEVRPVDRASVEATSAADSTTQPTSVPTSTGGSGVPRLRVQAMVRRDAITARSATGESTSTGARVDQVTLELRRGKHGWRIWSWH